MVKLANKLPLTTLHQLLDKLPTEERLYRLQALLFGVSGLLPELSNELDIETKNYLLQLEKIWNIYKSKFSTEGIIDTDEWDFHRTRPLNFPTRRIAALSYLLQEILQEGLLHFILSCRNKITPGEISSIFAVTARGYFAYKADFGSKPFLKPQMLIGEERSSTIAVNVLFPFLLYWAKMHNDLQLEVKLCNVYRRLPVRSKNRFVKLFLHRLFGDYHRLPVHKERLQQGLLQVFTDFCDTKSGNCRRCLFPYILELSPNELLKV
jgi:hypothetical protein